MAERNKVIIRPKSSSPPPNCAICLGSCTNKCFSDSCMHQFCFKCLLEWSKIKAECPLCKQAFKSIIHNVISNEEYDEHVVETTRNEEIHIIDNEEFLFLPIASTTYAPMRHEFHVRTTFTVDSRGEHAIQQMLLTHPLTNGGRINYGNPYPGRSSGTVIAPRRERTDYGATSFRRSIYARNLWVNSLPDVTGHYRDISPSFFRENPAARTRLSPWLNRELNALLFENTPLVLRLTNIIMENLLSHHICSRTFRNLLHEYLESKTDQFVHEFYNFMRSPFDMIGYDRHIIYTERPQSPAPYIDVSDHDGDSDVIIVGTSQPAEPVVIDLINSDDSDEPIIVSTESQVPLPIMPLSSNRDSPPPLVNLPPKLRHKRSKGILQEKEKWRRVKRKHRHRSKSSSSTSSSSSGVDDLDRASYRKYKKRKLMKKLKAIKRGNYIVTSSDNDSDVNVANHDDNVDNDEKPLIEILRKKWRHKEKKDKRKSKSEKHASTATTTRSSSNKDRSRREELPRIEDVRDVPGPSTVSSFSFPSPSRIPNHKLKREPPPTIENPEDLPGCSTATRFSYTPPHCSFAPSTVETSLSINSNDIPSCSRFDVSCSSTSTNVATTVDYSYLNGGVSTSRKYLSDSGTETEVGYNNVSTVIKTEVRPRKNSLLLKKQNNRWYVNDLHNSDTSEN